MNRSLKNLEKEICLLFPSTPGVPQKRVGLPCLSGMSQNQSLPGTAPWTLGLGSMPCDQMAVIAGNPRPCRRVAYGCLQHPGPVESIKMADRVVASQSTFLKEGEVSALGESPAQAQNPVSRTRHDITHRESNPATEGCHPLSVSPSPLLWAVSPKDFTPL